MIYMYRGKLKFGVGLKVDNYASHVAVGFALVLKQVISRDRPTERARSHDFLRGRGYTAFRNNVYPDAYLALLNTFSTPIGPCRFWP